MGGGLDLFFSPAFYAALHLDSVKCLGARDSQFSLPLLLLPLPLRDPPRVFVPLSLCMCYCFCLGHCLFLWAINSLPWEDLSSAGLSLGVPPRHAGCCRLRSQERQPLFLALHTGCRSHVWAAAPNSGWPSLGQRPTSFATCCHAPFMCKVLDQALRTQG